MNLSDLKFIYFDSVEINKDDIIWGMLELGLQVARSKIIITLNEYEEAEVELLMKEVKEYDFVITQNFSAALAKACNLMQKPYISWIYDSPFRALYRKEAKYSTNFIFAFDKCQIQRLKEIGVNNIFYQPLVANMTLTSGLNITDEDIARFSADVSFVGQLYRKAYYDRFLETAPETIKKEIQDIVQKKACHWEKGNRIFGEISARTSKYLESVMDMQYMDEHDIDMTYLQEVLMLSSPIACEERTRILNLAAKYCNTALYTKQPEIAKQTIRANVFPPVSYESEMYKVFFSSKINLNISLRSIETGIPQRVFDIMSVGGFVMSNYQEEMEELFLPDKEIVLFQSEEEFVEKMKFYLQHDDTRVRIGINGYQKVKAQYNYPVALANMLTVVLENM